MKNSKLIETSNKKADDPYLLIKWYWTNYFKKYWLLLILGIIFMGLEGSMLGLLSYSIKSMFDEVFVPSNQSALISVGLIIAIASATQDITVDALRIEQINENEGKSMAAGAAMAVVGWWTGYKLGGVVALFTAEYFENLG